MTTRLPISSTDIASEAKFELADGKIVTLKTFCIEEAEEPRVSIADLRIGDRFQVRDGRTFKIIQVSTTAGGDKLATDGSWCQWFYNSGNCVTGGKQEEVTKTLPATVLDLIDRQLAKLDKGDISVIVISRSEFVRFSGGTSEDYYHNGVRVKFNESLAEEMFSIKFKGRS